MAHREAEVIGRGIHPVRYIYQKFCNPVEPTVIVWDGPAGNKQRRKLYPEYKTNRLPQEESKHQFFNLAKGVLQFAPIIQVECHAWEADDVIGTLIEQLHTKHKLKVISNDGDYWQHSGKCYLPLIAKKWHAFTPEELILYKAIAGDKKDNIPGIYGFGPKSWDQLSKKDRQRLTLSIKLDDYNMADEIVMRTFPIRVKSKWNFEMFQALKIYWQLNKYWTVPDEDIKAGTKVGKSNIAASEILMGKYLI